MTRSVFVTSILSLNIIFAQNTSYKFDYYDISNGLSQNRAQALYQGKEGYIYVGSQGGLDRFDGYNFKYYSHNPSDSTSIPTGWVSAISHDENDNLWIGTTQKTIGYQKPNNEWVHIDLDGMKNWDRDGRSWWWGFISDIKPFEEVMLISSNGNGLFFVNDDNQKHYKSEVKEVNIISEIFIHQSNIFLATAAGLYRFDQKSEEFIETSISGSIGGLAKSSNQSQFYVTTNNKVYLYNHIDNSTKEILININKKDRDFRKVVFHNEKLWIVNENYGIVIHDVSAKSTVQLKPPSVKDTEYFSMIIDRDNAVWIGTASYGLMKYDPGKQKFNLYSKNFPASNPLGFDVAWSVTIDKNGNYWTGKAESNSEIVKIDRNSGEIKRYIQSRDPKSWFWRITKTNDGMLLWKGYPGRNKRYWYEYKYKTDTFSEISFFKLFPDSVGSFSWVESPSGTYAFTRKGIKKYNGKSFELDKKLNGNFSEKKYPGSDYFSINKDIVYFLDRPDSVIYKWETLNGQIKPYFKSEHLQQDAASFVVFNDSLIYLTTYGFGLVEININQNTKQFITVSSGLPSQHLYRGYLGNDNKIWVSSNYGIFSFDPLDRSVKSYLVADGLQDFEFNGGGSSYQARDGELIFAGIRGINHFYPKDIIPKSNPPQVIIQNAVVGDKVVNMNDVPIEVPWYDNKVVFDFAALSYRNPSKNQYSYFMDGYEDDWVYSGNRRFATYTNLPAGEYTCPQQQAGGNSKGAEGQVEEGFTDG